MTRSDGYINMKINFVRDVEQKEAHAAPCTDVLSREVGWHFTQSVSENIDFNLMHCNLLYRFGESDKQRRDFIMSCRHVTFFKDTIHDNKSVKEYL
ncbi:hypothetical protein CDAR_222351 [Caerostris darwini]|uniref:Uncharacterized protein n=1 Tax=Caerostris darwini TaxID=1538125 RepID=A0AAV4SX59_9ARAC|nr:hypothetical protein CDAR_222351 [Caerostris darwini]